MTQKLKTYPSKTLKWLQALFKYCAYTVFVGILILSFLNTFLLQQNMKTLINKVEDRFFGNHYYRISTFDDLNIFIKSSVKGFATKTKLPEIYLNLDEQKISLMLLESRIYKEQNINSNRTYHNGRMQIYNNDENEDFRVKIRGKGDREFHFLNKDSMSYRVNIRDEIKFNGMDKFSIQKPILRNYSWEYLIADVLHHENLLTLISQPVDFIVNDKYKGIYSVEEVPSIETLRRNKRPDGPIYSLDESYGHHIDSVLDVYNFSRWQEMDLYNDSSILLYKSFSDALNGKNFKKEDFDFNEWAKYFALIDLFGTHHAAVPKSVKIYFNPEIKKFQPILFDAHQGAGRLFDFILLDLLDENALYDCEWICSYVEFFNGFLSNQDFLNKYLYYLDIYSRNEFIRNIQTIYTSKYQTLDNEFYSRFSQSDAIAAPGLSLYFFKFDKIFDRQKLIQKKIKIYHSRYPKIQNTNNLVINN